MIKIFRTFFDELVVSCIGITMIDRIIGYLSYQRRRKTRRVIERRMHLQKQYPDSIQHGPFQGMLIPDKSCFYDARFEKVFGFYEHELFDVIQDIIKESPIYDRVVISGAADGFYAVGLALKMPSSTFIAFEQDSYRFNILKATSELNQTSNRVECAGRCDPLSLEQSFHGSLKPLLVCDVDGYEDILIDPQKAPSLKKTSILVETHDCFVEESSLRLKDRFKATHSIKEIHMKGPDYGRLAYLSSLKMHEVDSLLSSDRPMLQTWLWMQPRLHTA